MSVLDSIQIGSLIYFKTSNVTFSLRKSFCNSKSKEIQNHKVKLYYILCKRNNEYLLVLDMKTGEIQTAILNEYPPYNFRIIN